MPLRFRTSHHLVRFASVLTDSVCPDIVSRLGYASGAFEARRHPLRELRSGILAVKRFGFVLVFV
jgi:hypothetical protein